MSTLTTTLEAGQKRKFPKWVGLMAVIVFLVVILMSSLSSNMPEMDFSGTTEEGLNVNFTCSGDDFGGGAGSFMIFKLGDTWGNNFSKLTCVELFGHIESTGELPDPIKTLIEGVFRGYNLEALSAEEALQLEKIYQIVIKF